jgi:hypothetical protein
VVKVGREFPCFAFPLLELPAWLPLSLYGVGPKQPSTMSRAGGSRA